MLIPLIKIYTMRIYSRLSLFSVLMILASCNNEQAKQEEKLRQDSLLQVQQDSLMNVFHGELEAIASKVKEVNAKNGIFNLDTSENKVLSKETILSQVESLDQLLSSNQNQLNDLYKRMRDSKLNTEQLESKIKEMQETIAQREAYIDKLVKMLEDKDIKIDQILARVDSMRVTNIGLTEEVIKMDEEMHQVYYVVGEAKELKEKGITTKEGGLMGLGGSKKLDVSKLDISLFKMVDERDLTSIPLFSKKAKLVTNHPESSYSFKLDAAGQTESIEITDRKRFWMATDYLVVEVTN
jgi:DNA repair exonuclease SbcCD ATPase subunit